MKTSTIRSLLYFAGGLGLIVSVFTVAEDYAASLQRLCSVNAFVSCAAVANSGKTTVLGVPDSYIGIAGFVVILLLGAISESRRRELLWPYLLVLVTTAGIGFAAYFGYVELVEIGALCLACFTAYLFGVLAWVASILLLRRVRARARKTASEATPSTPSTDPADGAPTQA